MKNYRKIKFNVLLLKSVIYRIISFIIFTSILGYKVALLASILSFIFYYIYDYIFNKFFRMVTDKGFVLWFTGLPCSGKSTLADEVGKKLKNYGVNVERLDGDIVRKGLLSNDLGFSKEDRNKNINRITFVSKVLSRNGVAVLASFVSPYRNVRNKIRESVTNFIEIYVSCSTKECAKRDIKGMWKLAKEGKIKGFTGYDDPYERPQNPNIICNTERETIQESSQKIIRYLQREKYI